MSTISERASKYVEEHYIPPRELPKQACAAYFYVDGRGEPLFSEDPNTKERSYRTYFRLNDSSFTPDKVYSVHYYLRGSEPSRTLFGLDPKDGFAEWLEIQFNVEMDVVAYAGDNRYRVNTTICELLERGYGPNPPEPIKTAIETLRAQ
jgi:hypothetical protein